MENRRVLTSAFLLCSLILSACSPQSRETETAELVSVDSRGIDEPGAARPTSLADSSAEQTAINYYSFLYGPNRYYEDLPIYTDLEYWKLDHGEEVMATVDVAELMVAGDLALALVRFSVAGDVFRKGVWLRMYSDLWTISSSQYFSTFSNDDPFNDGNPSRAKEMIEKKDEWEINSAEFF